MTESIDFTGREIAIVEKSEQWQAAALDKVDGIVAKQGTRNPRNRHVGPGRHELKPQGR